MLHRTLLHAIAVGKRTWRRQQGLLWGPVPRANKLQLPVSGVAEGARHHLASPHLPRAPLCHWPHGLFPLPMVSPLGRTVLILSGAVGLPLPFRRAPFLPLCSLTCARLPQCLLPCACPVPGLELPGVGAWSYSPPHPGPGADPAQMLSGPQGVVADREAVPAC